ncbi:pyridoxal phosphate-dependent aminotransferase [Okeania sp. KiyG1]|uniref:pyridoxal phosphate-dependent aminotransferase n=1 Tax=Okeania sp. KiyG1 TaxID=2720165 RepID=UPI001922884B|nr:pyridoxal phosphate-dependent aminotransferase [Okeania sp. KiyG1]GGA33160.1 aminotransferase [Okeania sp. KiyG1]
MNFATRMNGLGGDAAIEVFTKAKYLESQGRNIIHLEIGQPDFKTPQNIREVAFQAMNNGYTTYTPAAGLLELREVIAEHISQTRNILVNPDEVVVMPGAKPVIFFTLLALINSGDEVIYPNPGFPVYESVINLVGGKSIPLPLLEDLDFQFSLDSLINSISERTKLLILNSPHNPTGSVLTPEYLEAIAKLAVKHNFYILSDEIYSHLVYDSNFSSIISFPGMKERTILLDGHSKTYAMTGWRLGYSVSPKAIAEKLDQLMLNSNSCACSFTQIAGIEAIKNSQGFVKEMFAEFKERRDVIVEGLNSIGGINCGKPAGAFYAFPNVKQLSISCEKLADYLLSEAGVALLPGTAYGNFGDGYLRLSYANSIENIREGIRRIKMAIEKFS